MKLDIWIFIAFVCVFLTGVFATKVIFAVFDGETSLLVASLVFVLFAPGFAFSVREILMWK